MTAQIDKIDVVEALAEALDDQVIGILDGRNQTMTDRDDRDDIADLIEHHAVVPTSDAEQAANAILASPWLARRDTEVAAKALEDAADRAERFTDMIPKNPQVMWNEGVEARRAVIRGIRADAKYLRASSLGAENPEVDDSTNGAS